MKLLYGRDCKICSDAAPPCSCASDQTCIQINRTCDVCSSSQCVPNVAPSSPSTGVSTGALVGAIIGALIFVAFLVLFAWWYRRRIVRKRRLTPKEHPARAEDVLGRPDPNEKSEVIEQIPARTFTPSNLDRGAIQVYGQAIGSPSDSSLRESVQANPFEDSHSIKTTSTATHGTNIIPIALVPPSSLPSILGSSPMPHNSNPTRPGRTPELDLNLEHLNVSKDSAPGSAAGSQGSNRNSYLSNMSYSSDFLTEVPMIITPTRGPVRQVLGVVKAEVIQTSLSLPPFADVSKSPVTAKPTVRSPLAGSSFGPADVLKEVEEEYDGRRDPFDDVRPFPQSSSGPSPTTPFSVSMHGLNSSEWAPDEPSLPWARPSTSRPASLSTQAGSIIADIGSATRVQVGYPNPTITPSVSYAVSDTRTLHRMTSARLVTPPTTQNNGHSLEQQQKVFMSAHRDKHRVSGGSVLSTTSTKADSILESFPFVPPSPISDRPARVAPRSPLAQQPSAVDDKTDVSSSAQSRHPFDRRILGMSTGSQMSSLSAGLESFPFQIEGQSPDSATGASTPHSVVNGRARASLDTLALTSDLSSYPLAFDRKELHDNYPLRRSD